MSYISNKSYFFVLMFVNFTLTTALANVDIPDNTATLVKLPPSHQLIFTTTDGLVGVERKANAIIQMIEEAPPNKRIHIVFKPSNENASYYKTLTSLISAAVLRAKKEKNVRVRTLFVNDEIAKATYEVLSERTGLKVPDLLIDFNQDGFLVADELPANYVERLNNSASIVHNLLGATRQLGRNLVEAGKNTSFSGLAFASILTYAGFRTHAPSWVYVSDGDMTKEAMLAMALGITLLYTVPRNEKLTKSIYEIGYEFSRSGFQLLRWFGNKVNFLSDQKFYLTEANPLGFNTFRVAAATLLYALPIQMAFYSLQDGAVWNDELYKSMFVNSVLIGAASAPWSFATDKIKSQTRISNNAVTLLRTLHLMAVGMLAVGIPYSSDLRFFALDTPEGAMLVGSGVLGLWANGNIVKLINKIDNKPWWRFLNQNFEALTNLTGTGVKNFVNLILRRSFIPTGFISMEDIKDEIFDETHPTIANEPQELDRSSLDNANVNQCAAFLN